MSATSGTVRSSDAERHARLNNCAAEDEYEQEALGIARGLLRDEQSDDVRRLPHETFVD
ncbi:MAG TPA: hypothetical protein VGI66_16205 [Streptosporangiaceae bacterium]|jgi:hypothetical protein